MIGQWEKLFGSLARPKSPVHSFAPCSRRVTKSNVPAAALRWLIERAGIEFRLTSQTLRKSLAGGYMTMNTLETTLKVQSRTLKQIKREGKVALYELYGGQGLLMGYEVVVIRIEKAREIFGKQYPDHETYPSSEEWGTYGWSYLARDLAGAEKRFDSLLPKWGRNLAHTVLQTNLAVPKGHDSGTKHAIHARALGDAALEIKLC